MLSEGETEILKQDPVLSGRAIELLKKIRLQRRKLFQVNEKKLKTLWQWSLGVAGRGLDAGAGFWATLRAVHGGLLIVAASTVLWGVVLVTGLTAS
jgi:hypothetical protein